MAHARLVRDRVRIPAHRRLRGVSVLTGTVRFLRPRRDDPHKGRNLRCRTCGDLVRVYELPGPWLDPKRYQCGSCMTDVTMRELPVPFSEQHPPRRAA